MISFTNLLLQFGNLPQEVISLLFSLSSLLFQEEACSTQLLICSLYLIKYIIRKESMDKLVADASKMSEG
jgi:hypothetical protein